jgi:hypothetical protein
VILNHLLKRFSVFFFITLFIYLNTAHAKHFCFDFFQPSLSDIKIRVENLNRLDLLEDMILVYDSALLQAIEKRSFTQTMSVVQAMKAQNRSQAFFDEINIAIALGANRIAIYLFEMSQFDYRRTPLRNDFLMSSVYFNNISMLNYFILQKKIKFSSPSLKKALRWAALQNQSAAFSVIEANMAQDNQR